MKCDWKLVHVFITCLVVNFFEVVIEYSVTENYGVDCVKNVLITDGEIPVGGYLLYILRSFGEITERLVGVPLLFNNIVVINEVLLINFRTVGEEVYNNLLNTYAVVGTI